MRELMKQIQLETQGIGYKVAVVVAADRLRQEGANAFLKTLEEPLPDSILILLSTEPQRVLETLVSRCLRLSFGDARPSRLDAAHQVEWLGTFSQLAATEQKSLMSRYCLLDTLLRKLTAIRANIKETLGARSPLQQYQDAEKNLVERWEEELTAAIEAEYRRHRADLLGVLHWWLRDVWVNTLARANAGPNEDSSFHSRHSKMEVEPVGGRLLNFPDLAGTRQVATRISPVGKP